MLISIFPIWFNSQHFLPDATAPVAGILATGERQAGRGVAVVVVVAVVVAVGRGPLCLEADVGNS